MNNFKIKLIGVICLGFIIVSLLLTIPQQLTYIEFAKEKIDNERKRKESLEDYQHINYQDKPSWELTNELISYILLHLALFGIVLMVLVKKGEPKIAQCE